MSQEAPRPIRKAVILGHSGFIGSRLARTFAEGPDGLDVSGLSHPDVDLTSASCQMELANVFTPDSAVILCAAVKRQFGDTLDVYHQNMTIVENLAAAVAESPVARVAFMSSAAVYGEETHNTAIRETTPVNPTSYYGIAKFTGECLLRKAFAAPDSPSLICFRPPLVYGPGDRGKTYGPAGFCAAIREKSGITLWGDGTELREFLFIDDLCRMIRSLTLGSHQGPVNLVTGTSYRFIDVINQLRDLSPQPFEVQQRPRSKNQVDNAFDGAFVRSLLPADFAFTPLKEGIRTTLESQL